MGLCDVTTLCLYIFEDGFSKRNEAFFLFLCTFMLFLRNSITVLIAYLWWFCWIYFSFSDFVKFVNFPNSLWNVTIIVKHWWSVLWSAIVPLTSRRYFMSPSTVKCLARAPFLSSQWCQSVCGLLVVWTNLLWLLDFAIFVSNPVCGDILW